MQIGANVNNYLTSIVARTLNIAPLVRPRLRGRFDPVPTTSREPVDPSLLDRTVPSDSSRETESGKVRPPREKAGRLIKEESGGRRDIPAGPPVRPPEQSLEADRPTEPQREKTESAHTTVLDETVTPAPKTIRVEGAEIVPENLSDDAPAVRPITQPASQTSGPIENRLTPPEHQTISAESWTIPPFQPPSMRFKESYLTPQAGYLPAAEPDLQTTIRGEEPLQDLSLRDLEPQPKLRNDDTPEHQEDSVGSTQQAVITPTRIAPRIEIGPERFLLNRQPSPQPQPTIHVTIGRVEVRAVRTAQPARSTSKDNPAEPVMKLDEYLRGRNQGSGR